ncbi:MAG: TonB-dependent receptor [Proteobacteria bacterium]|nr:TonB-dependent receptor [Pseudomonadota bacterium]
MKTFARKQSNPVSSGFAFKLSPMAAACAALFSAASGSAFAQQAEDSSNRVVVTGIAHSIETSIAAKRNSDSIIEAVTAEDLGKLPDISIADALARLPGLTAQRVDGRAQVISIRGLSPNYAGALLNGREVVSSSDSRAAEYDQFPSELVGSAIVYKTPDASLIGQGLSGTVDVRALMPLDVRGRQAAFNVRGERNSNGKLTDGPGATGNRVSASYVDQFANNTIGVAIGFAHLDSPEQEKYYQAWKFGDYVGQWGANMQGVPSSGTGNNKALISQGFDAGVTSSKQIRDGLMAVLEYKPSKDVHSVLDLYYSKFDQDRTRHMLQGDFLWSDPVTLSNPGITQLGGNSVVTSGQLANARSLIRNDNSQRSDVIKALGWKNEVTLANKWTAVADLSYSHSARDETWIETYSQPTTLGTYTFSGLGTPGGQMWSTNQNLSDPKLVKLNDSHGWGVIRTPHITDEIKALRLVGKRDLEGIFSGFESGLNFSTRDKNVLKNQSQLALTGAIDVPAAALRAPTDLGWAGINSPILSFDVPSVMGLFQRKPKDPWDEKDSHYSMHEKVTTLYGKFNIDSQFVNVPVRGNIGLQYVHTLQRSDGYAWISDKTGERTYPVSDGTSYNDFLPSLNLAFNLQPSLILRYGLAKTMARPRMDDLRAGADQPKVNTNPGPSYGFWSAGNGGNPLLQPWRATGTDVSVEKYFGKRSYVAVAVFYKDLKSFIYDQTIQRNFAGFPNNSGVTPFSNLGNITAPANGSGGTVDGIEFSTSLEGALLSPMLDGFGVTASVSSTQSSLHEANDTTRSLDGLSGIVNNLTVYYEKHGFSTRISQRYRSAFEATTRGVLLNNETSKINGEKIVDFQVGYGFENGMYKGLSVLLQVNNLTNRPYQTTRGPEVVGSAGNMAGQIPWVNATYGRTMLLGLNYKL